MTGAQVMQALSGFVGFVGLCIVFVCASGIQAKGTAIGVVIALVGGAGWLFFGAAP